MKLPPNYLYVQMNNDARQALYESWCNKNKLDPNLEYSVEEFFLAIDSSGTSEYQEQTEQEDQVTDLDLNSSTEEEEQ